MDTLHRHAQKERDSGLPGAGVFAARAVVLLAACVFATYILTGVRTQYFGTSPKMFAMLAMFGVMMAGPAGALAFLGLGIRRVVAGSCFILVFSLLMAESFGFLQEASVLHEFGQVPEPNSKIVVERWAPFQHHSILYTPGTGWTACE